MQKGFTLIELLLVLVIVSLATTLALPYASRSLDNMKLKSSARRVEATMKHASALSLRDRSVYSARASGNVLRLYAKNSSKEVSFPDGIKIESADTVLFYPEGGSSGGTFRVSGDKGAYTVAIEPYSGLIKVRSDDEAQGGKEKEA